MGSGLKVWLGAAVVVAIYLLFGAASDQVAANFNRCSAVHCT